MSLGRRTNTGTFDSRSQCKNAPLISKDQCRISAERPCCAAQAAKAKVTARRVDESTVGLYVSPKVFGFWHLPLATRRADIFRKMFLASYLALRNILE